MFLLDLFIGLPSKRNNRREKGKNYINGNHFSFCLRLQSLSKSAEFENLHLEWKNFGPIIYTAGPANSLDTLSISFFENVND